MTYDRFEQLPVWQAAMNLAEQVFVLTRRRGFVPMGDLRDQLRRAALSVANNIAEGFERGTTAELLSFLYIARGSAGEVRSMLLFCRRLLNNPALARDLLRNDAAHNPSHSNAPAQEGSPNNTAATDASPNDATTKRGNLKSQISNMQSEIADLVKLAESCSRQIRAWAAHLQDSDIAGQRRLNTKTRQNYDADKRAQAFWDKLQAVRDGTATAEELFGSGRDGETDA
ncbi:MAG: four helix bundle protein [Phycisphaerae bacterium]|nr:four helix bundle protein [Phycisphaerae bacterium]